MMTKPERIRPPGDEDEEAPGVNSRWKLDRHVPVALLAGIAVQTFVAVWWAATFSATITGRVDAQGDRIITLERTVTSLGPISERLVKMETKFDAAVDTLKDIKTAIEKVPTRQQP